MNLYPLEKALSAIFFPQRTCVNCGGESIGAPICRACTQAQSKLRRCPDCATFLQPTQPPDYRCSCCRGKETCFVRARAALPYAGTFREQILAFKYADATGLRRPFAALLYLLLQQEYADIPFTAIVPVPLSPARLQQRGYNQSELLSALLSKESGIPHRPQWLRRQKDTPPLYQQTRAQREKEMQHAFAAEKDTAGATVLLIDDIYTTGSTCRHAAKALMQQGAAAVYVLTLAASLEKA